MIDPVSYHNVDEQILATGIPNSTPYSQDNTPLLKRDS